MTLVIRQVTMSDAEPIWALFVHPRAQGRGYGQRLHDVMVGWLRQQGAPALWLTTGQDTAAAAFYEHLGWQRAGVSADGEARYELPDTV